MRRVSVLIALFAIVAALSGALLLLRRPLSVDNPAPVVPAEESYRMLYTRAREEFDRMTVTLASGERYTVVSDLIFGDSGQLLGVNNSMGQPLTIEGDKQFALDETSYQMMLLTAVNLPVTASYPALDRASCGLLSPRAVIEIAYKTGDMTTLRIGNPTASGYSCYVAADGDTAVHLVPLDFYEVMTKPLAAHHRLPGALVRAASDAMQIAVVSGAAETFMATRQAGGILTWQVTKPFLHYGSADRITAFIEAVCAVKADAYVTTAADADALKDYGLDAPERLLIAFADGVIRDIQIGADAGEGARYARMDATGDIYRVRTEDLSAFYGNAADALLDRYVALIAASDAEKATVALPGSTVTLTQTRNAAGETTGYARNGTDISKEVFNRDYTAIVGVQFDKTTLTPPVGTALAAVRFDLTDGGTAEIAYYAYNAYYVQAVTGGGGSFLLRTERLTDMLSVLFGSQSQKQTGGANQ